MQVKNKEQVWERFIEMNEDNQLFTFTDDKKGFLDYTGKVKNVIGSKNVMLEELAREVLVQTLLRTERKYLGSEIEVNVDGAKCRADLVVNINNEYASCIELKEVDVDKLTTGSLNLVIEDAFAQVGSRYLSKFNKDCFISVVVMDMNVILSKENALTLYHNLLVEQKKSLLSTLKEYGICIVTKKYNLLSQQIEKDIWYSIPSTMRFYEKKDDSSLFGISKLFLKLDEAVNLRTSSSNSGGSKNVRDIKDGNYVLEKRMLVLSILSTLIEAFNKNDPYYFARAGGSKKIVVVEDETLTFTARVGDDISYAISTMNGALIDGQNSLDSVACIMEAIENKLNPKSASGILEKQIFDRLSKSFNTADKLSHFLRFIKDSFVGIEVSKAKDEEEASKVAISQNHTIAVRKNELNIHQNINFYQVLSNVFLNGYNINVHYPKKELYHIKHKELKTVQIDYLLKAYSVIDPILDGGHEKFKLINILNELSGAAQLAHYKKVQRIFDTANLPFKGFVDLGKKEEILVLVNIAKRIINIEEALSNIDCKVLNAKVSDKKLLAYYFVQTVLTHQLKDVGVEKIEKTISSLINRLNNCVELYDFKIASLFGGSKDSVVKRKDSPIEITFQALMEEIFI